MYFLPPRGPDLAAARNLAAETAKGEILVFIDADVVVKPDTIGKVARVSKFIPRFQALFGSYDDEPAEKNFLSQYKNLQHHFVHQNSSPEASTFWSGLVRSGEMFLSPTADSIAKNFRCRR